MEKPKRLSVVRSKRNGEFSSNGHDGRQPEYLDPIRKQALEDRRRYMREYMRAYRRAHPGLSTPYVRKYRAKKRDLN